VEAAAEKRFELIHVLALMLEDDSPLSKLEQVLSERASTLKTSGFQPVLILESLDLLIGPTNITAQSALALLYNARAMFDWLLVVVAANNDKSPRQAAVSAMQVRRRQFTTSLLHQADITLSARRLDTGQAKDVSGVLRLTLSQPTRVQDQSNEFLYRVDTNLSLRVWTRGTEMPL